MIVAGLGFAMRLISPLLFLLLAGAPAAYSGERPHIELRPVVDCAGAAGEMQLSIPAARGRCASPEVIESDADLIGARHGEHRVMGDELDLTFSDRGRDRMYDFSRQHVGQQIAIIIDGDAVSVPVLIEPLLSPEIEVSGLSNPQIDDIVARMKAPRGGI